MKAASKCKSSSSSAGSDTEFDVPAPDAAVHDVMDQMMMIFSPVEQKRIQKVFNKLDTGKTGSIKASEFLNIRERNGLDMLNRKILSTMANEEDEIDLTAFINTMCIFCLGPARWKYLSPEHVDEIHNQKLKFAFDIYDFDGDGFLSMDDLVAALAAMRPRDPLRTTADAPVALTEEKIVQISARTIAIYGENGHVDFSRFKKILTDTSRLQYIMQCAEHAAPLLEDIQEL